MASDEMWSVYLGRHIVINGPDWQAHCEARAAALRARPHTLLSQYAARAADAARQGLTIPELAHKCAAAAAYQAGVADYYASLLPATLEVKAYLATGDLEGYLAVFNNTDHYNDVIRPGAFADSLAEAKASGRKGLFPLLWQHHQDRPVGLILDAREDARGLWIHATIATNLPDGAMAHEAVKAGVVDGLSIGYRTLKDDMKRVDGQTVRELLKVALIEGSLVTLPANQAARIVRVN